MRCVDSAMPRVCQERFPDSMTPRAQWARGVNACVGIGSGGRSADPQAATALDGAPFLFAHPAPDAGVLTGFERPLEALVVHGAPPADGLGLLDLQERRAGRPDREEQLRVLV